MLDPLHKIHRDRETDSPPPPYGQTPHLRGTQLLLLLLLHVLPYHPHHALAQLLLSSLSSGYSSWWLFAPSTAYRASVLLSVSLKPLLLLPFLSHLTSTVPTLISQRESYHLPRQPLVLCLPLRERPTCIAAGASPLLIVHISVRSQPSPA